MVVAIELPENKLNSLNIRDGGGGGGSGGGRWGLGETLRGLPHLTRLVVSDNAMGGALPASGYEQLDVFDVQVGVRA